MACGGRARHVGRGGRWAAGCFGCEACPYRVYCPALRDLASFAGAAQATWEGIGDLRRRIE